MLLEGKKKKTHIQYLVFLLEHCANKAAEENWMLCIACYFTCLKTQPCYSTSAAISFRLTSVGTALQERNGIGPTCNTYFRARSTSPGLLNRLIIIAFISGN